MKTDKKIVFDLDGTLIKVDLFKEQILRSFFTKPSVFFRTIYKALFDIAAAKSFLSKNFEIDPSLIPYNQDTLNLVKTYKKKGYKIIISTGAHRVFAEKISNYINSFDLIISTGSVNNVGINKLSILQKYLDDDFIYVGDSTKDFHVWNYCKKAIYVGNNKGIIKKINNSKIDLVNIIRSPKNSMFKLLKQLRIYQWSKNLLIFLPIIASHNFFEKDIIINSIKAFCSFSFLASSIYIFNDIIDLEKDRIHPKKKNRPLANGDISALAGFTLFATFFILAFLIAISINIFSFSLALLYVLLNFFYSKYIKKILMVDIIFLTMFYILRIMYGHLSTNISISVWLISFSLFLFFSLGVLKRYIDIKLLRGFESKLKNSIYKSKDEAILLPLGLSSGLLSSLVLLLYVGSSNVQKLYDTPMFLFLICPVFICWISRIWILVERESIKDDPVLFALKDLFSYVSIFIIVIIALVAKLVNF